jgi:hypothetical protein
MHTLFKKNSKFFFFFKKKNTFKSKKLSKLKFKKLKLSSPHSRFTFKTLFKHKNPKLFNAKKIKLFNNYELLVDAANPDSSSSLNSAVSTIPTCLNAFLKSEQLQYLESCIDLIIEDTVEETEEYKEPDEKLLITYTRCNFLTAPFFALNHRKV